MAAASYRRTSYDVAGAAAAIRAARLPDSLAERLEYGHKVNMRILIRLHSGGFAGCGGSRAGLLRQLGQGLDPPATRGRCRVTSKRSPAPPRAGKGNCARDRIGTGQDRAGFPEAAQRGSTRGLRARLKQGIDNLRKQRLGDVRSNRRTPRPRAPRLRPLPPRPRRRTPKHAPALPPADHDHRHHEHTTTTTPPSESGGTEAREAEESQSQRPGRRKRESRKRKQPRRGRRRGKSWRRPVSGVGDRRALQA